MNPTATYVGLSPVQADGLACVICHRNYLTDQHPARPVGFALATGSQVFACTGECHAIATTTPEGGEHR